MRYAGVIKNDFTAAPGTSLTVFTQGCPHHCPGCHNPETWNFNGGKEMTEIVMDEIIKDINANGILRNFCIMGGEPLCNENLYGVLQLIQTAVDEYPNILVYIWTGYTYEELQKRIEKNDLNGSILKAILQMTDYLIDGPYVEKLRDITLQMRGSSNQRIIPLHKNENKN